MRRPKCTACGYQGYWGVAVWKDAPKEPLCFNCHYWLVLETAFWRGTQWPANPNREVQ